MIAPKFMCIRIVEVQTAHSQVYCEIRLSGRAGSGKSSIARALCTILHSVGFLNVTREGGS